MYGTGGVCVRACAGGCSTFCAVNKVTQLYPFAYSVSKDFAVCFGCGIGVPLDVWHIRTLGTSQTTQASRI
jgi:hypothetical protein